MVPLDEEEERENTRNSGEQMNERQIEDNNDEPKMLVVQKQRGSYIKISLVCQNVEPAEDQIMHLVNFEQEIHALEKDNQDERSEGESMHENSQPVER